jgi:hypothetical protein
MTTPSERLEMANKITPDKELAMQLTRTKLLDVAIEGRKAVFAKRPHGNMGKPLSGGAAQQRRKAA